MNPKHDQFIVEWFGECWHEQSLHIGHYPSVWCSCGKKYYNRIEIQDICKNINLSTPDGFFWLWPKMREDAKLWEKFLHWLYLQCSFPVRQIEFLINYIEPSNFADAVGGFLKSLGVKSYDEFLKGQKNESVT